MTPTQKQKNRWVETYTFTFWIVKIVWCLPIFKKKDDTSTIPILHPHPCPLPKQTKIANKSHSASTNQPPNHTIPTPCSIHLNHLNPTPKKWHLHRPHRIGLSRQLAHGHLRHRQAMPQDAQRSTRTAATHGVELRLAFAFRGGGAKNRRTGEKKTENAAVFLLGILIGILISDKKGYPHSIVWVFGDWNLWMYKIYCSIVNCMICVFRWESVLHENYYILWI